MLQAIGRGLRIHESKKRLTVIDIVDNLSVMELNKETGRMHRVDNFSFIHHNARLKYYSKEGFPYEVKEINMEANNGS